MKKPKNTSKKVLHPGIRAARQVLQMLRGEADKTGRNKNAAPHRTNGARITFTIDARKSAPPAPTPKRRTSGAVLRLKRQMLQMLHTYNNENKIYIHIYIGGYIRKGVDHPGAKKRGGGR